MDPILQRREILERMGFLAVEHDPGALVAVRVRWRWDCFLRSVAVVRVRRVGAADLPALQKEHRAFVNRSVALDWTKTVRGLLQYRVVLDVLLLEPGLQDADALRAWARRQVDKGFGLSGHVVVVDPDGTVTCAEPLWGRAYWGMHRALVDAVAAGEVRPEPAGPLEILLGWGLYLPSLLVYLVMCCGLPLLVPLLVALERPPRPAPPPLG